MNLQDIRRVLQKNKLNCLNTQAQKLLTTDNSNVLHVKNINNSKPKDDVVRISNLMKEFNNLKRIGNPDIPVKLSKLSDSNLKENNNKLSNFVRNKGEEKTPSQKKKRKILTSKIYSKEKEIDSEEQGSRNTDSIPTRNHLKEHITAMKQSKKLINNGFGPQLIHDISKNTRNRELQNFSKSLDLRLAQEAKKPQRLVLLDNTPSNQSNHVSNSPKLIEKDFKSNFDNKFLASLPSSCNTDISAKIPKLMEKLQNKYFFAQQNPGSMSSIDSVMRRKNLGQSNLNFDINVNNKSLNDKKSINQYIYDTNSNYENSCHQNRLNKQVTNNPDEINKNVKTSKSKKNGCGCFSFC